MLDSAQKVIPEGTIRMSEPKSRFVAKLEELGFERFTLRPRREQLLSIVATEGEDAVPSSATAHMQVPMLGLNEPCYTTLSAPQLDPGFQLTVAFDDEGQAWIKKGEVIELEQYGFTAAFKPVPKN